MRVAVTHPREPRHVAVHAMGRVRKRSFMFDAGMNYKWMWGRYTYGAPDPPGTIRVAFGPARLRVGKIRRVA